MYRARIDSPFGPMLLCGSGEGLAGLYFTDQKDCPPLAGGPRVRSDSRRPGSGTAGGVPLRTLRPARRYAAGGEHHCASMDGKDGASGQLALFADESELAGRPNANGLAGTVKADPVSTVGGATEEGALSARDEAAGRDEQAAALELLQEGAPEDAVALFALVQAELAQYFAGERKDFSFPLQLSGTPFQTKVWNALCRVPYGEVASYGDLAVLAGMTPGHGRPVGTAVGRNPVAIVVPCHRIIGSNRTLTGYTGGLERKVALLELEGFAFGR